MNTLERVEKEFNYIDYKTPENNTNVVGYCEPMHKADIETEVFFSDNKFFLNDKEIRCFYWKLLAQKG